MLPIHGAVSNGAIHTSCGPKQPRWKIPRRRGVWRHAIQPRRHRGGRHAKGSDRELILDTVYFVLNFAKKAIFVIFYVSVPLTRHGQKEKETHRSPLACPPLNQTTSMPPIALGRACNTPQPAAHARAAPLHSRVPLLAGIEVNPPPLDTTCPPFSRL
jgi:hypothetical protein